MQMIQAPTSCPSCGSVLDVVNNLFNKHLDGKGTEKDDALSFLSSRNKKSVVYKGKKVDIFNPTVPLEALQREIKNISFGIQGNTMTSFVGHSGAGKSTILNLIPRFYNSKSGDIKIDNQSIYNSSLYSYMGIRLLVICSC